MKWKKVTVITTHAGAELVADLLTDAGSEGVMIRDAADVKELIDKKINWDYADEALLSADPRVMVSGFYPEDFCLGRILSALDVLRGRAAFPLGSLETDCATVDSVDWENEWRKYYAPIEIGKIVIVPAWQKAPDTDKTPVYIEPGMAFGTGNHETTAACLDLMQRPGVEGKTVLDMGCGSGILGVTAAVLGAREVVLSDIDPQATSAAMLNAALNGVEGRCRAVTGDLDAAGVRADMVVANITADVLIRLSSLIGGVLAGRGYIVLSGIIAAREADVLAAFTSEFEPLERESRGEWKALLMRKRA